MKVEGLKGQSSLMIDNMGKKNKESVEKSESGFSNLLNPTKKERVDNAQKITEMIDNIDKIKGELEHELTVENLKKYKEAVRSFLNYFTKNEMHMQDYYLKDKRTLLEKRVTVIKTVNEKMNEMTENMLETNRGHLETLNKIGEINGLIVNMFI